MKHKMTKDLLIFLSFATFCVNQSVFADEGDDPLQAAVSLRRSEPFDALQGELMVEGGQTITWRAGLSFFASTETDLHGGIELGLRTRTPSRISPFVGAGLFSGSWTTYEPAESDGIDNDNDSSIDELGEEEEVVDSLWAVYPEVGLHIWLTDSVRITGTYRYYITTDGRESDRALYGIGLGFALK